MTRDYRSGVPSGVSERSEHVTGAGKLSPLKFGLPARGGPGSSCQRLSHQPRLDWWMSERMLPAFFKIRDLTIRPAAVLAPMAGVTDTLFRRVIRGLGSCGLLMTEFTSSEGITRSV